MAKTRRKAKGIDHSRLCEAAVYSRKQLEHGRQKRAEAIEMSIGAHWSERTARVRQPVNFLGQYMNLTSRSLVSDNPRVMLSTMVRPQQDAVKFAQEWVNRQVKRVNLADVLHRATVDALLWFGVAKVALTSPLDSAAAQSRLAAGDPAAWCVSPDDYVIDMKARGPSAVGYEGHRYRVPVERANELLVGRGGEPLQANDREQYNEDGTERASTLALSYEVDKTDYRDHADVWELWIPSLSEVWSFRCDETGGPTPESDGEPLSVQPWVGHRGGPYTRLEFALVPDNLIGIGPVMQLLVDLHQLANSIFRKLQRQVNRLKKLTVYGRANEQDAAEVKKANDGDMLGVTDVTQLREVILGGVAPMLYEFFVAVQQLFNWFGGNVSLQAGLGQAASTATQEKLLASASNATVAAMQAKTVEFAARVMERMGWYWWQDPDRVMELELAPHSAPEYSRTVRLHPYGSVDRAGRPRAMRRQVPFDQLDLMVDPFSMRHRTPEVMAGLLMESVERMFMPLAGLAQQQGVTLNVHELFRRIGDYRSMPDLASVFSIEQPPQQAGGGSAGAGVPETPGSRAPTHSIYERRGEGETPESAQQDVLAAMKKAGSAAQSEGAA